MILLAICTECLRVFYLLFWRLNTTVITRPTRFLITAWAEAILVLMVVVTKSVDRAAQINYFFVYSSECLFRTADCVLANEICFFSKSVDREAYIFFTLLALGNFVKYTNLNGRVYDDTYYKVFASTCE